MTGLLIGLACLAFAAWGLTLPQAATQRPQVAPRPSEVSEVVGGVLGSLGALLAGLLGLAVWLSPLVLVILGVLWLSR